MFGITFILKQLRFQSSQRKNKKSKLIFVKRSTTLLQSRCCSLNGLEMASKRRKGIVFSIGKAEQLRAKCPVYGCQLHVVERFNDVAIHIVNGRMASPEEGFAKQFQSWIESTAPRNHNEVKEMYRLYHLNCYKRKRRISSTKNAILNLKIA